MLCLTDVISVFLCFAGLAWEGIHSAAHRARQAERLSNETRRVNLFIGVSFSWTGSVVYSALVPQKVRYDGS